MTAGFAWKENAVHMKQRNFQDCAEQGFVYLSFILETFINFWNQIQKIKFFHEKKMNEIVSNSNYRNSDLLCADEIIRKIDVFNFWRILPLNL